MTTKARLQSREWEKDSFLLSTNPKLIPIPKLMAAFDSDTFYWTNSIPADATQEMVENSLSFGLYNKAPTTVPAEPDELVGFARCVTDFTTFAYLTDVYVDPSLQGKGLGSWMIECVDELLKELPYLRRTVLFTGDWKRSVPFYRSVMGMEVLEVKEGKGLAIMEKPGNAYPESLRNLNKE
ncbi:hypothetical protein CC79DRAFT_1062173 [Sarocladium strictum]